MESSFLKHVGSELRKIFGSDFRILRQEGVGGGCISRSAKLKTSHGDFFIKWNGSAAPDLFLREAEGLTAMGKATESELIIPKVILSAKAGEWPGFIVLEFLNTGYSHDQAEKLGIGLAGLHRYCHPQFGFYRDNYCGSTLQKNAWQSNWIDFFIHNRLLFLLDMLTGKRRYEVSERKVFDRLIVKLPGLLLPSSSPALIHGDLWSGNCLYTEKGPALIDPAVYFADREMELSMMSLFGGFSQSTWSAYQAHFPLEAGWEERIQIYQLYHLLNHYCLFGGSYGRQSLFLAKKFAG